MNDRLVRHVANVSLERPCSMSLVLPDSCCTNTIPPVKLGVWRTNYFPASMDHLDQRIFPPLYQCLMSIDPNDPYLRGHELSCPVCDWMHLPFDPRWSTLIQRVGSLQMASGRHLSGFDPNDPCFSRKRFFINDLSPVLVERESVSYTSCNYYYYGSFI